MHASEKPQALTLTTPDGALSIIGNGGFVLASGWTDDIAALSSLVHKDFALGADGQVIDRVEVDDAHAVLQDASAAVSAYYAGSADGVQQIPVKQLSGPFRMRAWDVLREVQPGETLTYAEYAGRCGNEKAARAAASACAMNAVALFIPCHRIVRSDGTLGGFRYGIKIKESLLARESSILMN
ncbi:methylated-DNA--[protein]-cysteine S-methyltransferase [Corynebacterium pseudotuberculosis]|uniref:Methylated-DNA--[protein]-cysteine S-methyltransferase n=1 Tax=Corynebacterium pseudotuberculosis 258 TaxID=1168865 RepID=A0AAU8PN33_CORPS|nr:methylated-DNA--[protein]-cysteine S-methyltransferase [Corynebacterium pseudotuberculosis]AER69331.1 Methylated-DNA--protein-cysteinemethyltransferase [Corynebacterium pseudotuberculosis 1/06-A]AEQ06842.2 methylated-DNA--[protein]-cysteine S-methyltransferase [Corynebacterium pseudotuberculosis CIP 52.97]AFB72642.2 methylated-DNA--[protein]-cysteine S-methyltransferase [Corynebacterium pseudotuberculosis 316]AFH91113.1 methylated-DNA--[protein]-cysteine S-methyltransferase [Corynebacterium 